MKRRLAAMREQYARGEIEYEDIKQRLNSWLGHAKHGHTYRLRVKILQSAVFKKDWEAISRKEEST